MPLSLVSKKSIRDNENSLNENLSNIEKSLGVPFTAEFDFEDIINKCNDNWVTNNCGSIFYKEAFGKLASNMERVGKDQLIKESFLNAVPNRKFVFICGDEKLPNYWVYKFENGDLQIHFRPKIANTDILTDFKLETILPVQGVYSSMTRLNIRANEQKMKDALTSIKKAMKSNDDWKVDESSLESVYPFVDEKLKISFYQIFASIVENVAENLSKSVGDDEMVLEAVQEVTPNRQIVFKHDPNLNNDSKYWSWKFESGNIVLTFKAVINIDEIKSFDFIKLL